MRNLSEAEFNKVSATILNRSFADNCKKGIETPLRIIREVTNDISTSYIVSADMEVFGIEISFKQDNISFSLEYTLPNSKYQIFPEIGHLRQIDRSDLRKQMIENGDQPNLIGVFTTGKIKAWIKFQTEVYKKLESMNQERQARIDGFLQELEGLNVEWDKERTSGKIERNGLVFSFNIDRGYIFQTIEFACMVAKNIDSFKKLSDNQYRSK